MTYRCTGGFVIYVDGQPQMVRSGDLVDDTDPILTTHRNYFEPAETHTARRAAAPQSVSAVETASAAPGQARQTDVTRRAGRASGEKQGA
jgi:hypothetical protein